MGGEITLESIFSLDSCTPLLYNFNHFVGIDPLTKYMYLGYILFLFIMYSLYMYEDVGGFMKYLAVASELL